MISDKQNKTISKFLSLVLRHQPELIGITLDNNGWADIDELIEKSRGAQILLDPQIIKYIVDTNTKKRFALNDEQTKIRANQGHSIGIELNLPAAVPPNELYHGTAQRFVESISFSGLIRQQRQHVHLSADRETAVKVGARHGKPFVFTVMAGRMHDDGFVFFLADNGVWLTDHVPEKYLLKSINDPKHK